MKTIIIPTDFSPAATHTLHYGIDMANAVGANLLLFHVYQVPVSYTDVPLVLVSVEELARSAQEQLSNLKKEAERMAPSTVKINTEAVMGNVSDELENCCARVKPFAVLMGSRGASGLERVLFGSTTLSVIRHLDWPVICIPPGKNFGAGIKKIGFACDFKHIKDSSPLEMIRNMVREFGAELHVLNVDHNDKHFSPETPAESAFLHSALKELNPAYHFIEHRDIEDGINEFAEKNNLDLVITIPKKHKLLDGLFNPSSTKQLVFYSHVPVMCVHE